ncbi:MAG: hypothetical protein KGI83_04430 [Verrucomicrobiota bacterium]|nr:hypothetical protein [Verrucomicrobiota bacterium]
MNSKVGNLAKPTPQVWGSEAATKQLNLNKFSDGAPKDASSLGQGAGGPKNADVRRSQKPTFEFTCV